MKVLFFGGTGFFGQSILRSLIRNENEVTFVTRGNSRPRNIAGHHIQGDRRDITTFDKIKAQGPWDAVIDNIAYTAQDVIDTISVIEASHYILTSTIAISYPYRPLGLGPASIPSSYALNKLAADQAVRYQTKIPWTIFRPAIVYGPNEILDRTMWYVSRLLNHEPIAIADPQSLLSFVFSEDIAQAYLKALYLPESKRCRAYTLCQDEHITLEKFIQDHAKALGVDAITRKTQIPELGTQGGPYSYHYNFIANNRDTKDLLDWRPSPWESAVQRSIDWFRRKHESTESNPTNHGGRASGIVD